MKSPNPHLLAEESARLNARGWKAVDAAIAATGDPTNKAATTAAALKDKLKKVESDIAEARQQHTDAAWEAESAKETFANKDGADVNSDEFKTAKAAMGKVGEIADHIDALEREQIGILEMMGKSGNAGNARGRDRAAGDPCDPRGGWDASALLERDGVPDMLDAYAHASEGSRLGRQSLGEIVGRDALAADVAGSTSMRRGEWAGILPQLRRQLRILDLLPTGTMDGNTFPYTVESGAFTGAAETTEGVAKPEGGVTFTDAEATARTIAAWMKLQKQSLDDTPALRTIIETRLRYLVERRLEAQILAGNGSAPNLQGILGTSGIGAVDYAADELPADQILSAITTVLLADATATGVAVNPLDWQDILKAKAAGDGHYYSGGPFSVTPQVIWGIPLIPSPAIAQGTVLAGDWEIGAMLLIRQGVQVLLSDSDQDDFTRNKVTLLGEMRAALPVFRPAAFCTVDLAP